jgi:hypothetical protein
MGSIYYCVEDLYMKIFSKLCTLDEFTNLLTKPQVIILKEVTLSEKISITQQNPKLKKFSQIRYRLISIDSSDYLTKLKQLLITNKNQQFENIINQMRSYKQTSTSSLLHDKGKKQIFLFFLKKNFLLVSTKRLSIDNTEREKRLKCVTDKNDIIETTQFGIFIQCNGPVSCNIYPTNEVLSSKNRYVILISCKKYLNEGKKNILLLTSALQTEKDIQYFLIQAHNITMFLRKNLLYIQKKKCFSWIVEFI